MQWESFNIEIITPCFCAGADQNKAEIRVPSIRGQLRWWFRALGYGREAETQVFGAAGTGDPVASAIALRVTDIKYGPVWENQFRLQLGSNGAYIWYFAGEANAKKRWWQTPQPKNNRQAGVLSSAGHLPPGTTFNLLVAQRRKLSSENLIKWNSALEAFCRFGALGMRATRGMGNITCDNYQQDYVERAQELLVPAGFTVKWDGKSFRNWEQALFQAEKWLKNKLRKDHPSKRKTPLGSASPRQTSAVSFRIIKITPETYKLLIFEAPHERVLDPNHQTQTRRPIIKKIDFTANPPVTTQTRRYH